MASKVGNFEEQKLFKVVRELNVSQDRVVEFLENEGYENSLSGSGLNAKIVDEEAYLVLREEYADDAEAAARIRELRSQEDGDGPQRGEVATLDEDSQDRTAKLDEDHEGRLETSVNLETDEYRLKDPNGELEAQDEPKQADKPNTDHAGGKSLKVLGKMESEELQKPDTTRGTPSALEARTYNSEEKERKYTDIYSKKNFISKNNCCTEKDVTIFSEIEERLELLEIEIKDIDVSDKIRIKRKSNERVRPSFPHVSQEKYNGEDVVEKVYKYSKLKGYYFEKKVIANLYNSILTEDLTILAGMSGVGKSKLPKLFTEAVGGEFTRIPVRPNWTDEHDLLGYYNPEQKDYYPTRMVEKLRMASDYEDRLFLFCLDEMNLSKPEHYFARFLSQMEDDNPSIRLDESVTDDEIVNAYEELEYRYSDDHSDLIEQRFRRISDYQDVEIPSNAKFVGTVNIDSTTKSLSNKVIDRSNSIHVSSSSVENAIFPDSVDEPDEVEREIFEPKSSESYSLDKEEADEYILRAYRILKKLFDKLEGTNLSFGYRVLKGILRYVKNVKENETYTYFFEDKSADEIEDDEIVQEIIDLQITQRILPKFNVKKTKEVDSTLTDLYDNILTDEEGELKYEECGKVVSNMRGSSELGYVSFWENKVTS